MSNLSINEKDFLKNSLQSNLRFDGRGMMDHRKINISFGSSYGSVEVSLGDTKVQSKITATLEEPRKERPNEGSLKFKVDLAMMAFTKQGNTKYDKDKYSNEISKVLERVIKGSK
jgi:exosome complex component RRP45